ncbi:transglutaminase family protein [Gammaproteobacteria bacterium]|nr:transglutaminase family protein [Gammaproteobacteria bacterium]
MHLKITHKTTYRYDNAIQDLTQYIKLYPSKHKNIKIINWDIKIKDSIISEESIEPNGDKVILAHSSNVIKKLEIIINGEVKTKNNLKQEILTGYKEKINPMVYLRTTHITSIAPKIKSFVNNALCKTNKKDKLSLAHIISNKISKKLSYVKNFSKETTRSIETLNSKKGVCKDYAHLLISCAIYLNIPSRYVCGYLYSLNEKNEATHAWAELYFDNLGWVGFDPSNNCFVNDKYIRVCSGFDSYDAAPIKGVAVGDSNEKLDVKVNVKQMSSQQ